MRCKGIRKILTAALVLFTVAVISGCRDTASDELRLAGRYAYFDSEDGDAFKCDKGILTIKDGMITDISAYEEGVKGVEYLDKDQVMFPGLLNIHNHAECNMYQLFSDKISVDEPWDNRFEWRKSKKYWEIYKYPDADLHEKWDEVLQLFVPDREFDMDVPETYMPYMDTSDWELNKENAKAIEDDVQKYIEAVRNGTGRESTAYLIHIAEGRAGNLNKDKGTDAYCTKELESFMNKIETAVATGELTAEEVRNADIGLIHACAVDLSNPEIYEFIRKYSIGLIWSPVSNLLLYEDTPDFYNYLNDDEIDIAIGSDWTPSGSKTIWDECKFIYSMAEIHSGYVTEEELSELKANILKAVTVNAADIIGADKLGNIAVGKFADLMIINAGDMEALDAFYSCDDTDIAMVYVGGEPMYGDKEFFEEHVDDKDLVLANVSSDIEELNQKYYNITGKCDAEEFENLLDTFTAMVESEGPEVSLLRSSEDPVYLDGMQKLYDRFCR